ncbi:sugar isomerase domain-containing protein [Ochrobactrum soli]|uniref:SIS domain-containing protein n=1 Tax=Brucella/Ochrobactrum group TaxID=2826938 RepID=UPI000EF1F003|nr:MULTISPECIES: sugar isomerase domain-containing protein [Brucella]RLL75975.1 sugar isomerase domain-containing protein [[Ochrobactrum] soli]WHS31512.1 sugar isomerase domain-containing protein [Brucella sp. NM4]WHT42024.1 sugar isomerase domain-containing protein [Ochrobactrum sp. SSR]
MTAITDRYFNDLIARLASLRDRLAEPMEKAADLIATAARADRRVYVFGTGHSHMMAEELHYRAGGLAITVPILCGAIMLQDGAVASSHFERIEGAVLPILDRYGIQEGDVLIVVSNSGVNAAPIEAARYAREKGAAVIAVTSVTYSSAIAKGRTQLLSLADVVLDNDAPAGDAVLEVEGSALKVGPVSTALGVTILNAIFADVASRLVDDGSAPIYLSANMPGSGDVNRELVARYRDRNPHL